MRPQLTRICDCCKEEIPINMQTIGELVFFDKKYYHKDCFANLCKEYSSATSRKRNKQKWADALNNMDVLCNDTVEHIKPIIIDDEMYRFMMKHYQPTMISGLIWKKLEQIYKGTYKDMSRGIPPAHLLDMWKRKMKELQEIHNKLDSDGKKLDPNQQIAYDLSVLVNKYDNYLKWLEKQRIIEEEQKRENADNNSIKQIIDRNVVKNMSNETKEEENDIASLVEEIFS